MTYNVLSGTLRLCTTTTTTLCINNVLIKHLHIFSLVIPQCVAQSSWLPSLHPSNLRAPVITECKYFPCFLFAVNHCVVR